jgi:ferredoxin
MLSWLGRLLGAGTPEYHPRRCLAVIYPDRGCRECVKACPHDAVSLETGRVRIDPLLCTSCGLCVGACPAEALEADPEAVARAILDAPAERAVAACSEAGTDGDVNVTCHARLQPSAFLAAGLTGRHLVVVAGDCARCQVGSAGVPETVRATAAAAEREAAANGRKVAWTWHGPDTPYTPETARRDVLRRAVRSGVGAFRGKVDEALAGWPQLLGEQSKPLPRERTMRRELLAGAVDSKGEVAWPEVSVNQNCILCPVCTQVCPTEALQRVIEPGQTVLYLDLARCTGCSACAEACGFDAVKVDPAGRAAVKALDSWLRQAVYGGREPGA